MDIPATADWAIGVCYIGHQSSCDPAQTQPSQSNGHLLEDYLSHIFLKAWSWLNILYTRRESI